MKFTRVIGTFLTCIVLLFTCSIPVFASVNSSNDEIIVETKGYVPDNVSCEWVPNYANVLPSVFPNDWVGGKDDRTTISDPTAKPYLCIAALVVTYPSGTATGTGFMVSKNCMVTAGHVLVGAKGDFKGEAAQSIDMYFGVYNLNGKNYYKYKKTVTPDTALFYHDPNYTGHGESDYDYGFIKFNSDIEWDIGWLGLSAKSTSSLVEQSITVTGYESWTMKTHSGKIMEIYGKKTNNALFLHSADTDGGQSGSPVYLSDNKAVGIHIEGFSSSASSIYNTAWRITADFIYLLADYGCVTLA